MANIVWILISLLVLFWLVGFIAKIGGTIIHFLLIIALILLIFNLITGRKTSS